MVDDILVQLVPQSVNLLPELVKASGVAWHGSKVVFEDRPHVLDRVEVWGCGWVEWGGEVGDLSKGFDLRSGVYRCAVLYHRDRMC